MIGSSFLARALDLLSGTLRRARAIFARWDAASRRENRIELTNAAEPGLKGNIGCLCIPAVQQPRGFTFVETQHVPKPTSASRLVEACQISRSGIRQCALPDCGMKK
ncbi:hypothetical protein OL67_003975 (plasmid) [Phaeobacter piscinae]|nr:hypothetical protein OL67_003975 [Phaeobacter piscinae]